MARATELTKTNAVWMLLTAGSAGGSVCELQTSIGAGVRGEALRRVGVSGASADALESAAAGAQLAYKLLYREKYLCREIEVRFESAVRLENLHGRSADVAFAMALIAAMCGADGAPCFELPPLAATGQLNALGGIEPVLGVAEKIAGAIAALPGGAFVFFPRGNESELTQALRQQAADKTITLCAVARLEEILQRLGISLSQTWLDSPFRGLEPFEFRHASIFFGREPEIDELLALLHRRSAVAQTAVLVEGASGSGKSSLVLAGVLPALLRRGTPDIPGERFRWGLLRPRSVAATGDERRELQALAQAVQAAWLHGEQGSLHEPGATLFPAELPVPQALMAWLGAASAAPDPAQWVLVLDQMEQWFDGRLQPATVATMAALVAGLAEHGVWIIATATRALTAKLADHPRLAALLGIEGRYALSKELGPARLDAVIREPTRAARLHFEPGLDAEIFSAADHGGADVLPLLELLLTELYERRDQSGSLLRLSDYRAVGGLDGVISARAEAAFATAAAPEQAMLEPLIWKLETRGELRPSEYPAGDPMLGLVAAFLARRLLIEDAGPDGRTGIRVAHEALLRHWSRAVNLRSAARRDVRLWLDVVREAGQWWRKERSLIAAGPQLDAVHELYRRRLADWTSGDDLAIDYVRSSLRARSRRRVLVGLAVGLPSTGVGVMAAAMLPGLVETFRTVRIRFDDAPVGPPRFEVDAAPFLRAFGVSITAVSPAGSRVLIQGNRGLYEGRAAARGKQDQHFLTQMADPPTAPVSFTLALDRPARIVRLIRAGLWAATGSGVTHPAWTAVARNSVGLRIDSVSEGLSRSYRIDDRIGLTQRVDDIAAKTFVLEAGGDRPIHSLQITSDYRLDGHPFAGFQAVLLHEIQLVH